MNRLLQGDVGSGKTLVALMSMLIALDNGFQACMMAPTEILAAQHYETIRKFLFGMNVRVELLMGSVKGKKREKILKDLLTGDIQILIGTSRHLTDRMIVDDRDHGVGCRRRHGARSDAYGAEPRTDFGAGGQAGGDRPDLLRRDVPDE